MNTVYTKASQTESTPGLRSVQDHLSHVLLLLPALSSTKENKWYSTTRLKSTAFTSSSLIHALQSPINCTL